MTTLAELKDRLFRLTNDIYQDQFHMRDLLNTALVMLSDGAKIQGVHSITLVPNQASYDLPSGFKSVYALMEGTADNPGQTYSLITVDDSRQGFMLWGNSLLIKPTPTEEKTLNLYYYRYPTKLVNDADQLDSEFVGFEDVVASYAAAMILALPGMETTTKYLIEQYMAMWEMGKQRFTQEMAKRNKQSTVKVVTTW